MTTAVIVILVILIAGVVSLRIWFKRQAFKSASRQSKELFPVWAAQGPEGGVLVKQGLERLP